ncbi:MAG: uroporphyrinogen decarboxylase family protein [Gemmatimonadota bacterium]
MNPRQRVHAALRRQPVDRVPIFMWFHPDTARILGRALQIPPGRVSEAMGDDVRQAWVSNNHCMEGIVHRRDGEGHVDPWGVAWVKEGPFNQIRRSPLEDAGEGEVRAYDHPHDKADELLANMEPVVALGDRYFVGCDVSPCLFEMVCRVRGMERAILDLAARPDLARHQLERAAAFALHLSEVACQRYPLDWLWTGDDVAGQQAMMLSPEMWREMVAPHLARIMAVGKGHGLWVAYHSCGAIRPIIPDLVEMGLDVLNPVQSTCPGMDPVELKREFGDRLAFMGGVDTQYLLPHGTEAEVRHQTERLLAQMTAGGGGYILAASHTVPPETPLANVFALYEVAGVKRQEIEDRAADIRRAEGARNP